VFSTRSEAAVLASSVNYVWSLMSPAKMQLVVLLRSIISANKILSYPALSRCKAADAKGSENKINMDPAVKKHGDQPKVTIMHADRRPSCGTGFFKMTRQSIGGILFENKSADGLKS
jgi:hypothetical protein